MKYNMEMYMIAIASQNQAHHFSSFSPQVKKDGRDDKKKGRKPKTSEIGARHMV